MNTTLIETPREFTVLKEGTVLPLPVRRLSFRQIAKVGEAVNTEIRKERRKEIMALAELLDPKERNTFLMEAARYNMVVSEEDATAVADSLFGVLTVLTLATDLTFDELEALAAVSENSVELDYARYYALGLDIDSLRAAVEAADDKETKTAATFPDGD